MLVNGPPPRPEPGSGPEWPSRLGLALVLTVLQIAAGTVVFALSWIPALNIASEGLGHRSGVEYLVYGAIAAAIVALIVGLAAAVRMRMAMFGLYALPVPLAVLVLWQLQSHPDALWFGLLACLAGNSVIALATTGLPRRPRKPRLSDRGNP
ncbi:hypothetical protein [Glycomyces tritici]|uniref:Integral membrane protein n=1 Tax=Glycomyces tritici TaxID=2665176 RepID=A0ABT7YUW9_9ACTN|nr:hypothetical protein [Glycomyces tritici]MDN3242416.1 hypothetical protein [Glycomyces tritici]